MIISLDLSLPFCLSFRSEAKESVFVGIRLFREDRALEQPPVQPEITTSGEAESALAAKLSRRGRYRLDDLLAQSDPAAFERTEEDLEWLNSPRVGRELL
jgi:hypothetical protein